MEKHNQIDTVPDEAMRKRVKLVGNSMIAGVVAMGGIGAIKEVNKYREPRPVAASSQDFHTVHNEILKPVQNDEKESDKLDLAKDDSEILQTAKPAEWWPVGVKQHWLATQEVAGKYQIDPYIIATIMAEESMGQNINNPSGATGLMQIMPSTAQEIARRRNIYYYDMSVEAQNLDFAAWLIQYIDKNYIAASGVELESDLGMQMLAVGYGDGEGALQLWQNNGYSHNTLSAQARHVVSLWLGMYHNRFSKESVEFEKQRYAK